MYRQDVQELLLQRALDVGREEQRLEHQTVQHHGGVQADTEWMGYRKRRRGCWLGAYLCLSPKTLCTVEQDVQASRQYASTAILGSALNGVCFAGVCSTVRKQ